jgi:hypothetical protein
MTVAIVLETERPALAIGPDLAVDWSRWPGGVALPPAERIEHGAAAVGRLLVEGEARMPWVGTCFMVGPGLVFSAAFAISELTEGAGKNVSVKDGRQLSVQFAGGQEEDVARVLFIHPYFRVALLELAGRSNLPDPLGIAAASPEDLGGKDVALISCAANDPRNPADAIKRLYGDTPEQAFYVQPGKVLQIGNISGSDSGALGLLHDCTCVGGSSGGPLVDLSSGDVLGLHTMGQFAAVNYAEILWELARDPVVWEFDIAFRPAAKPVWLDAWDSPEVPHSPVPTQTKTGRWTVNAMPPIDFSEPAVKALLHTLFATVSDVTTAMNLALDAGVTRGTIDEKGSAEQVWRRILERASTKGVLGTLVTNIHDDPEYLGIKPALAMVL